MYDSKHPFKERVGITERARRRYRRWRARRTGAPDPYPPPQPPAGPGDPMYDFVAGLFADGSYALEDGSGSPVSTTSAVTDRSDAVGRDTSERGTQATDGRESREGSESREVTEVTAEAEVDGPREAKVEAVVGGEGAGEDGGESEQGDGAIGDDVRAHEQ